MRQWQDVTTMSVKAMKEELVSLGGSAEGCVERADVVSRLLDARRFSENSDASLRVQQDGGGQGGAGKAHSPPGSPLGEPSPASIAAVTGPQPSFSKNILREHCFRPGPAGFHVAVEGCSHGELDAIYAAVLETQKRHGISIDLLLICGDFQACRNEQDLNCMAVPQKYRSMASFHKYYSGEAVAPCLTIFVGGNHEASNHLWELFHGGWVAPNIYYLGHTGVVRVGGLRIAGLSGIFKGGDYRQGHWERPPYDNSSLRSAYHVREYDVFKLMQLAGHVDIFLSHDWPRGVHRHGNERALLQKKRFLEQEVQSNTLGNPHTVPLMQRLKPDYWFAAHLHTKFAALVKHDELGVDGLPARTKFLSLDKALPNRDFLQVIHFPSGSRELTANGGRLKLEHDEQWLAVLRAVEAYRSIARHQQPLPPRHLVEPLVDRELAWVKAKVAADSSYLEIPDNFEVSLPPYVPGKKLGPGQPPFHASRQTLQLVEKLEINMPHMPPANPAGGSAVPAGGYSQSSQHLSAGTPFSAPGAAASNPDEIDINDDVVSDGGRRVRKA